MQNTSEKQHNLVDIELSEEQKKLFHILENKRDHVFITGKAGTGKSVLLQYFKQNTAKNAVVVAPTGIAALNVGGQTIHSLFRIKPGFVVKNELHVNKMAATLLSRVDVVVIDEISMVRADLMDAIDILLQQAKGVEAPFGGVQIIMFGDLYQLPPVVEDGELQTYFADTFGGHYFFNASVWDGVPIQIYELNNIFRQKDEKFRELLNRIRKGDVDSQVLSELNKRTIAYAPEDGLITLAPTNAAVSLLNGKQLARLSTPRHLYKAKIYGNLHPPYPTDEHLQLKVGAQVLFVKNDKEKRWVNGDVGTVVELTNTAIKVSVRDADYLVQPETWNEIRYYYDRSSQRVKEEVVSSFVQYPLRLAWAITIHKSQGQTYDTVAVDMGDGAFAHGQAYVALSRGRSLEGLYLNVDIRQEDVIVDPLVARFMEDAAIL